MTYLLFLTLLVGAYIPVLLFSTWWRLRNVPGPLLAKFTGLWRFSIQYRRSILPDLVELHQRYGGIVRIGPNSVSVSDPSYVSLIYTSKGEFVKADSYNPMRVYLNGQSVGSIVDMKDEEQNRALKRAIGGAFTTKSILDYEPDVDIILEQLLHKLGNSSSFILHDVLQYFQLDFLMRISFSEATGHLEQMSDVCGLSKLTSTRIAHWYRWQSLAGLESFIYRNPVWGKWLAQPSKWAKLSRQRFTARLASMKDGKFNERRDLLQKCIDYSKKYPNVLKPETITSVVNSIISAGTDTTSGAMTTMIYLLLKHPDCYQLLLNELLEAREAGKLSMPPRYVEVSRLPYLDAVLREALRLNPALSIPMERTVPPAGCEINGIYIPGGTTIGCLAMAVHMDNSFGEQPQQFRPARWLTGSDEKRLAMERGFLGWSAGSRVCLGRHLAELEIKKVVPTLLLQYNIRLDDPNVTLPLVDGVLEYGKRQISVTVDRK